MMQQQPMRLLLSWDFFFMNCEFIGCHIGTFFFCQFGLITDL